MSSPKRHPLLIYRRAMDRLWPSLLVLGVLLGGIWAWNDYNQTPMLDVQNSFWLLGAAGLTLVFASFIFLARFMAYVQVGRNYLKLVTPFLQLRISFRRILRFHPTDFVALYPPSKSSWAERNFLNPFYGKTALVAEMRQYPLSKVLLRLFLAKQMFSKDFTGFIFLVPDWMDISTELDASWGKWQQSQTRRPPLPGSLY
jgi:hypothetical protein